MDVAALRDALRGWVHRLRDAQRERVRGAPGGEGGGGGPPPSVCCPPHSWSAGTTPTGVPGRAFAILCLCPEELSTAQCLQ